MVTVRRFDVYRLLPMCHVYLEARIKLLASECLSYYATRLQQGTTYKKCRVDQIKMKRTQKPGFRNFLYRSQVITSCCTLFCGSRWQHCAATSFFSCFLSKKYFLKVTAQSETDVRFDVFSLRAQTLRSRLVQQWLSSFKSSLFFGSFRYTDWKSSGRLRMWRPCLT
jgi:hypothetical protein